MADNRSAAQPPRASLLGLPAEIRQAILKLVLVRQGPIVLTHDATATRAPAILSQRSVLEANRLLREEGLPILYQHNDIRVKVPAGRLPLPYHPVVSHGLRRRRSRVEFDVYTLPPWPLVLTLFRYYWLGEIDGLETAQWHSPWWMLASRSLNFHRIMLDIAALVKANRRRPWTEVKTKVAALATQLGWSGIASDAGSGCVDERGLRSFVFSRLDNEMECP